MMTSTFLLYARPFLSNDNDDSYDQQKFFFFPSRVKLKPVLQVLCKDFYPKEFLVNDL